MSEEADKKKTVKKRPVARYFGALSQDDKKDVERIQVDVKKKPKSFQGDVIQVEEKAKYFPKAKWASKGKGANKTKQKSVKRPKLSLKVDPYAIQKHSRKFNLLDANINKEELLFILLAQ